MKANIIGSTLPVLEIELQGSDRIVAEPGEFSWMSDAVQMKTTAFTAGSKGVWGALRRAFSGGGLFMTEYSAPPHGSGKIAFAAKVPGSILQFDVQAAQSYLIHRHGFLCATEGVQLGTGFQRSLGAGIFGGNGFVMQKLSGPCTAWIELGGEAVTYDLKPGEVLRVHPGHVGMIEGSVGFDVALMRGFANAVFGGDGLFVARLTGPGRVAADADCAQSRACPVTLPRRHECGRGRGSRCGRCRGRRAARHLQRLASRRSWSRSCRP